MKRILLHISFWLSILLYHTLIIGSFEDRNYLEEMLWEIYDLPIKICTAYLVMYVLLPRMFMKRRIPAFIVSFVLILILAAVAQRIYYHYIIYQIISPDAIQADFQFFRPNRIMKSVLGIYPVVVLAVLIKISKQWYQRERESQNLEKEKIKAELNFLKSQVHPHFLFNTLNNLYALILQKSDKAGDLVIKLSSLMEYLLYEGNSHRILLTRDIEILEAYIDLEKIRYDERLNLEMEIKGSPEDKKIAPLLLLPFVENCFKHGASKHLEEMWIKILFNISDDHLHFSVENSIPNKEPVASLTDLPEGIGLQNVQRRLSLTYGNDYKLETEKKKDKFKIHLIIPLE